MLVSRVSRSSLLRSISIVACAIAANLVAAPGFAEDETVADVKVTRDGEGPGETSRPVMQAQKQPRAIVVIDPQTIEREQLDRLEEFQQKVPNYRANNGQPLQSSRQTIRWVGIGAGTGVGTESPTGFVVDNVFWKYWGFQFGDFVDLSSFDVSYGPQGTAGGKNTSVGNINIRTQLPSFTRRATVDTQFSSYGRVLEKVNVTGPINDVLAYRISAYVDKGDGWIKDKYSGASYFDNNRWGVRAQLLYVGENITDRFIFNYVKSDEYDGYTAGAIGDTGLVYANGARPKTSYSQSVASKLGRPILSWDPFSPALAREGVDPNRNIMVSNELAYSLGETTLTSISAYGFNRNEQRYFTDNYNQLQLWKGGMNTYLGQGSQEFRITSPRDQPLEWVGGIYLFYDDGTNEMHHVQFGADAAQWLGLPAALPGVEDWWHTKARDIQFASYAQGTWHIDEQWAITAGLRNSYEIREGSITHMNAYVPGVSSFAQDQAVIAAGGWGNSDRGGSTSRLNHVNGIFNPQYKYDDNIQFFGLVGRAEKAPAINTSGNPRYITQTIGGQKVYVFDSWPALFTKPEISWDYEIGAKTRWLDNKLVLNTTLYWNDFYNFQTNTVDASRVDATGAPVRNTGLGNAAHARLRGVEFEGRWSPIERLWINANAAFTDARWVSYPDAPPPADWAWPASLNNGGPSAPLTLSRSNTRWEKVPMWTANLGANYEQPLGNALAPLGDWANRSVTSFAYVNANWQDKTQLTDPNSYIQYWQRQYTIFNAGVGLRTDDGLYSLSFWGKNLLDERPFTGWSPGDSSTPANVTLSRWPRTIGGSFRMRFL